MAEIRIHRPWNYYGCARKLKVTIDGNKAGSVASKKSETFEVSNGIHTIEVSMDWIKSPILNLDLTSGGLAEVEIECAPTLEAMLKTLTAPQEVFTLHSQSAVSLGLHNPTNYPRP